MVRGALNYASEVLAQAADITITIFRCRLTTILSLGYKSPGTGEMPATILIAEDYEDNRELLRLVLATAEYQVLEAANGRDCLKMARANRPDLIMIDLSMPGLDGWGVFRELRADESTCEIPCIAITAHAEADRARALVTGFSAYLTKPFRSAELLETVKDLLDKQALRTQTRDTV